MQEIDFIFLIIFCLGMLGVAGYWGFQDVSRLISSPELKDKLEGFMIISICISLAFASTLYVIKRNNCMNGSSEYGKPSIRRVYSNGKISYNTPRSSRAIYCEDTEGINAGYAFKVGIISFVISFGSLYGGSKYLEKRKKQLRNTKRKKSKKSGK